MKKAFCQSCSYCDLDYHSAPWCDYWGEYVSEIESCDEHTEQGAGV